MMPKPKLEAALSRLRSFAKAHGPVKSEDELDDDIVELLIERLDRLKEEKKDEVPRFHVDNSKGDEGLRGLLNINAVGNVMESFAEAIPQADVLSPLINLVALSESRGVSYTEFSKAYNQCFNMVSSRYLNAIVSPQLFLALPTLPLPAPRGTVAAQDLALLMCTNFQAATESVAMLSFGGSATKGLQMDELDRYVKAISKAQRIRTLNMYLDQLTDYHAHAVSAGFFYVLDGEGRDFLRIQELISSVEFLQFMSTVTPCDALAQIMRALGVKDIYNEPDVENWFTVENTVFLYNTYRELDADKNGFISKDELRVYFNGEVSDLYIDRTYEMARTFNGMIDFKGFVVVVLALKFRKSMSSIRYFFNMVDYQQRGFLTKQSLRPFIAGMLEYYNRALQDNLLLADDLIDDIFDLCKGRPRGGTSGDDLRISFNELYSSGYGHLLGLYIGDATGYFLFDSREAQSEYIKRHNVMFEEDGGGAQQGMSCGKSAGGVEETKQDGWEKQTKVDKTDLWQSKFNFDDY